MNWYLSVSILLSLGYFILMHQYRRYWKQLPMWHIPPDFSPTTTVTVIVPARNEADNIQHCLQSILNQNYPADYFEIIVVDDFSTDDTVGIVAAITAENVRVLRLSDHFEADATQAFKKKGIALAIDQSNRQLIVTTDADCTVSKNWLDYLVSFYENHQVKFIAAPVNFYPENTLFQQFQSLDFIGMMGITGAGIQGDFMRMCNGANLAYEREAFYRVGGFEGIDHLASGDDMLLMQKMIRQFPHSVGYVKNAEARTWTPPAPTIREFVRQRVRWASKSAAYPEWQVTLMLALIFFFAWNIVLSFLLSLIWTPLFFPIFLIQLLIKSLADFYFLKMMSRFFNREDLMQIFWPAQVFHILYICGIGLLANVQKKYYWKGRQVR